MAELSLKTEGLDNTQDLNLHIIGEKTTYETEQREERVSGILQIDGWNNDKAVWESAGDEYDWPMGRHVGSQKALEDAKGNYTKQSDIQHRQKLLEEPETETTEDEIPDRQNRADLK